MSKPDYCCAGADMEDLPGGTVDHLFLNALAAGKTDVQLDKSKQLIKNSTIVSALLDSSGFSLGQAEEDALKHHLNLPLGHFIENLKLSPEYVVSVARRLRPTEFVALDFPIQKVPISEREAEFRRKLAYNLPWAIETAELREKYCPQIGLLMPIQCFTLSQLDEFLYAIKGLAFDGACMPTRAATLKEVALFLYRFWQAGIRRVHLLGVSKFPMFALAGYMARHYFDRLSFDSTTWHIEGRNGIYMNPHNLTRTAINENTEIDPAIQMDCDCPWCRNRNFSYIKHQPRPDRRQFLFCHNFFVISRMCETVYEHSCSIEHLEMFMEKHATKQQRRQKKDIDEVQDLFRALSVIETLKDKDTRHLEKLLI